MTKTTEANIPKVAELLPNSSGPLVKWPEMAEDQN